MLAGDFSEDIARPHSYEQGTMQKIINDATGLVLTTPRNPFNGDERTWSSRNATPTIRFDYILPGPLLAERIVTNWIFRTDFLSPRRRACRVTIRKLPPTISHCSQCFAIPTTFPRAAVAG